MAKRRKRRASATKKNPTRKGKTNRWISGKAFRVKRNRGKLVVEVKR
jgi:hypothetical protein